MKKVSLLAASVAIALTGCGGSDGDSGSTSPSGVTITGFDGYFNQAVVFDDKNNNGTLDVNSDIILGLTDSEGKLSLSDDEFASITSLALQTLTPGGAKQAALIASNPQLFAGKYTIDMDHPTQAMEHEVVFRTLPGGDVISPLTDLVVLEAGANPTEEAITAAKKTVNVSLGLPEDSEDAFGDVIANDDAELHKTAQILTESKANDPTGYESNPTGVAEEATKVVQDNPGKVNDENFKPIVDGDTNTAPVLNSKLVVNKDVKKHLDSLVDALELDTHEGLDITLPLALEGEALFSDTDNNDIEINATFTTKMQETITGVTLSAVNGGDLVITGTPSEVRDTYIITLSADDKDASENVVGAATTTLEIGITLENEAPEADKEVTAEVQEWADSLELVQGVAVKDESISILDLFTDSDDSKLSYSAYTSVAGLVVDVMTTGDDIILDISGSTPLYSYSAGETITISATDGINTTYETFTLPEIAKQSLEADPEEVTELQEYINELLADLKVGEEIDVHGIAIDELFETDSVAGVLEYYVGIEDDKEGYTSIPGVKVAIENDVYLKFSGTPTAATKNGYFNIAAGVNVDTDEEIVSEMVRFSIPAVEPADDVTPPPADSHPLEGKTWYNLETGSSDGSGQKGASRVWCDSIKFENGIIYGNVRSLENKTSCSEADTQEDEATYRIEGDKLIATFTWSKDGETVVEEHALVATESSEIADGAMTVVTTFENIEDENSGIESERYTYFADRSDAERRITTKSDDGPMKRFGKMYIPAAEQDSDNYSMQLGRVSYSISDEGDANEPFDADIYFDVDDMNVTCDMINKTYSNFLMTSDSGVTTDNWGCFDNIENEVHYATVNFFPESGQLVVGEVYSLIGYVENYDGETEAVKFNIEWTGEANED
ncbi:hypothetical protein [Vibrio profundi]|uniref:hypothetical protein n=1 Tax=Vibrio profundi TaxID=1774960 RepID=UPI003735B677